MIEWRRDDKHGSCLSCLGKHNIVSLCVSPLKDRPPTSLVDLCEDCRTALRYAMPRPVVYHVSMLLEAYQNCVSSRNVEWAGKHGAFLQVLVKDYMPSGSGIDMGVELDITSQSQRIVLTTQFHHMTEHGMYDGWTEHSIIVTPRFSDIGIQVTGRNRNQIKEYLHEVFHQSLMTTIPQADLLAIQQEAYFSAEAQDIMAIMAAKMLTEKP